MRCLQGAKHTAIEHMWLTHIPHTGMLLHAQKSLPSGRCWSFFPPNQARELYRASNSHTDVTADSTYTTTLSPSCKQPALPQLLPCTLHSHEVDVAQKVGTCTASQGRKAICNESCNRQPEAVHTPDSTHDHAMCKATSAVGLTKPPAQQGIMPNIPINPLMYTQMSFVPLPHKPCPALPLMQHQK